MPKRWLIVSFINLLMHCCNQCILQSPVGLVSFRKQSHRGGLIEGRRHHKPYYWTVQWCRKVKQSGWLIGCFKPVKPAITPQLLTVEISILLAQSQICAEGQPSQWTFLHHNTALMLPPPYTSMNHTSQSVLTYACPAICYLNPLQIFFDKHSLFNYIIFIFSGANRKLILRKKTG